MGRGRPRKTDPDTALEVAMRVFWDKGFEGTSMNDIAEATGMAKPGLYATFGDKEGLYAKALTRYFDLFTPTRDDLVTSTDSLEITLRRFLLTIAQGSADRNRPGGCFVVNSVVECAGKPPVLKDLGRSCEEKRRGSFVIRFKKELDAGRLPVDTDIEALADFFDGQCVALAVMGRAGGKPENLHRLIDVAMTVLPK